MAKKRITLLALALMALLFATSVSAFVESSTLKMPFTVFGKLLVADRSLATLPLTVCNLRTAYCETTETNKEGEYQVDMGNFLVNRPFEMRWMPYDEVSVKYCEDVYCLKKFNIGDPGFEYRARIDFNLQGSETVKYVNVEVKVPEIKELIVEKTLEGKYKHPWAIGLIVGIVTFLLGLGIAGRKKANKIIQTVFKNLRAGKYGR